MMTKSALRSCAETNIAFAARRAAEDRARDADEHHDDDLTASRRMGAAQDEAADQPDAEGDAEGDPDQLGASRDGMPEAAAASAQAPRGHDRGLPTIALRWTPAPLPPWLIRPASTAMRCRTGTRRPTRSRGAGVVGIGSIFSRSRRTWTVTVEVSP